MQLGNLGGENFQFLSHAVGAYVQAGALGVFGPVQGAAWSTSREVVFRTPQGPLTVSLVTALRRQAPRGLAACAALCGGSDGNTRLAKFTPDAGTVALASAPYLTPEGSGRTGLVGFNLTGQAYFAAGQAVGGTGATVAQTLHRVQRVSWTAVTCGTTLTGHGAWTTGASLYTEGDHRHSAVLFGGLYAYTPGTTLALLPASRMITRLWPGEVAEVLGLSADSGYAAKTFAQTVIPRAGHAATHEVLLVGGLTPGGGVTTVSRFRHGLIQPEMTALAGVPGWGGVGVGVPSLDGTVTGVMVAHGGGAFPLAAGTQTLVRYGVEDVPVVSLIQLDDTYTRPAAPVVGMHAYLFQGAGSGESLPKALAVKRFSAAVTSTTDLATVALTIDSGVDTTGMTGVGLPALLF